MVCMLIQGFEIDLILPPDPLPPNQQHLTLFLQEGESPPIPKKSNPFQNEVETKVFSKLNTLDLSLVAIIIITIPYRTSKVR